MRRVPAWIFIAALLATPSLAQLKLDATRRPTCTNGTPWQVFLMNESTTSDCDTTAGGALEVLCCCLDGVVASCASAGAGGNSFETINTPTGTDPVADSATDTLNITCAAPLLCPGDSTTDTIAFSLTGLILDLGDDGGNDSTALVEIATIHDDYNAVIESSADKALIDFAKIPPYQQYDPARPPSSCATCDEFTSSINTGLYTWGNQGTATATAELSSMRLYTAASAATDRKVLWYTTPSSADFVLTIAVTGSVDKFWPASAMVGVVALETGTIATPTLMSHGIYFRYSGTQQASAMFTSTSYTSNYTLVGALSALAVQANASPSYLQLRYVDSTKALSYWHSFDGFGFYQLGSNRTLGAAPVNVGICVDQNTANTSFNAYVRFARIRTDATGVASPFPVGE